MLGVPSGPMFSDVTAGPHATVVRLGGDLDLLVEHELTGVLTDVARQGQPVVIDMAEVTLLDSSGMRALVLAQAACTKAGTTLSLRAVPGQIRRLLEIVGFDATMPIVE